MAQNGIKHGVWRTGLALLAGLILAAPAAAQQASEAQRDAIRLACPADYQAHCANVPAAGQAAFACLARNLAQLSPPCQRAVSAVSGGAVPHAAPSSMPRTSSPAPSAAAEPSAVPMTPRQTVMALRHSCGGDFRAFCRGVRFGGGSAIACLRAHAGSLSAQCGKALSTAHDAR